MALRKGSAIRKEPIFKSLQRSSGILLPLGVVLLVLIIWETVCLLLNVPTYLVPRPTLILGELISSIGRLGYGFAITLGESLLGFLVACLIGFPVALGFSTSKIFTRAAYPLVLLTQFVPLIILAPLIWFILGGGVFSIVVVGFIVAVFPIIINTVLGLGMVEPEKIYLVRSMGASTLQLFFKIKLPTALPTIFVGLKISATLAVTGAFIAEYISASKGVASILLEASGSLDGKLVFASAAVLAILGYLLFYFMVVVQRLVMPWETLKRKMAGTAQTF